LAFLELASLGLEESYLEAPVSRPHSHSQRAVVEYIADFGRQSREHYILNHKLPKNRSKTMFTTKLIT
jgi:hypothetical protein